MLREEPFIRKISARTARQGHFMTPNTNTKHAFTISHSFLPGRRFTASSRALAAPRRTSAVLSAQELRQIVCEMVD